MNSMKPRVFVALSGGVDSSVAAALLKKAGFNVVGVFLRCWQAGPKSECVGLADERMARLASSVLKIPFLVFDFVKEYREKVLHYLIKEAGRGLTPNPDILCNREIKFGVFFKKAVAKGADFVATGHYVRLGRKNLKYCLLHGKDKQKDQSYFLTYIDPKVLPKVLFPVGNYKKDEVRQLAKKFGLPNAKRPSSRGLCFVGKVNFHDFLKRYLKEKPGPVVEQVRDGVNKIIIGRHPGLAFFTIGQRQGLGLAGGPYFVVGKDIKNNSLIVSRKEKDLYQKEFSVKKMNWFLPPSKFPLGLRVKIRYRQKSAKAVIFPPERGIFRVVFAKPQRAIAPGQFAVFYQGQGLLGGGVICA